VETVRKSPVCKDLREGIAEVAIQAAGEAQCLSSQSHREPERGFYIPLQTLRKPVKRAVR
jgi:hypothetical protein